MKLIRASQLIGMPIVSVTSGESLAEVRDVVYDADDHRLLAFTLNEPGAFGRRINATLPVASVTAIGPSAVTVADDAVIATAANAEQEFVTESGAARVLGVRVLSAAGEEMGEVVGVILELGDQPQAVGYEIAVTGRDGTAFVPITAQSALSATKLVVSGDAADVMRDDFVGFGAAVYPHEPPSDHASALEVPDTDLLAGHEAGGIHQIEHSLDHGRWMDEPQ